MSVRSEEEIKYYELSDKLRKMRLSGMAAAIESVAEDDNLYLRDPLSLLAKIVDEEWTLRYEKKFNRFLKKATLKYPGASLDKRLYDPVRKIDTGAVEQLAKCSWIDEGKNLTVTGKTGTGKTYLVCALEYVLFRSSIMSNTSKPASFSMSWLKPDWKGGSLTIRTR